ncbi:hypothetical protein BGZ68_004989 [Mortierella alpina]|nr:hypothetical protein BGZ68_004989 [Mortierella alpina]
MRGSQTWQLEPEWTPLSSKSPAQTLEPTYLRAYLSKEPLCPGFDPKAYSNLSARPLVQGSPSPRSSVQQGLELEKGQARDPQERPREYLSYTPSPSTPFLAPSVSQPASSYEIRLLIDRLSSLDGSISSMQQRLDEHERQTQQAETVLQKQIAAMLDQRDKELLSAMEEKIQAAVDSVRGADGNGGVTEKILQQVGQLGQEAREAHLELHGDLEEQFDKTESVEKKLLGGLKELKDEMHGSKTEIDRLRSVVSQQSQMLGLIVEQHRTATTQLSTLQMCMNSCLAERRDISRPHQVFGTARMLSPPADPVPFDALISQEATESFTSPSCTHILDQLSSSHLQCESQDNGQSSGYPGLTLTPAASMAPSEPEETAAEAVEPSGWDKLTKVSVTYSTQDEGSVTDIIHVSQAMPAPTKKSKHSNRRSRPRQTGNSLTTEKLPPAVLTSVKKRKLPQKARAPVTGSRTRLQHRKQQEQQNFGDKELTLLFSGPVHMTRAKRTFLHMEDTHLDLDAIARRGLPLC